MTDIKARPLSKTPARGTRAPYAAYPRPYLARNPRVGFAIFWICAAVFALLTWLVKTNHPLIAWDAPAAQAVHRWAAGQSFPVVFAMRFFSAYGRDGIALLALLLTAGWVRKRARRELWLLFFGFLGSELMFQIFSGLVNRARPEFKDPFETLIGAGYPSGHAATNVVLGAMVLYLILPHIKTPQRRALLVAGVLFYVIMVIFSRLFLGLHYPTDMIAGVLLGLGWAALIFTVTDLYFWGRN